MRNIAIILAAGRGSRMESDTPKQFLPMEDGRTILEHSIRAFHSHPLIDEITVVTNAEHIDRVSSLVNNEGYTKLRHILPGGAERYESSLVAIRQYEEEDCHLLIHDAARPYVSQDIISACVEALNEYEAVVVATPTTDTIIELSPSGNISRIPSRSLLRNAQTPQCFHSRVISRAFAIGLEDPNFAPTDDSSVVRAYLPEVNIHVVLGSEENKKITYPTDLTTVKSELRKCQEKQLSILMVIDKICRENDIEYWLDGGTLLGAVRHGGFIPWDDDIDIAMTRENLLRFEQVVEKALPPHLVLQSPRNSRLKEPITKVRDTESFIAEDSDDFTLPYCKGLYVDIFPFEDYPNCGRRLTRMVCRNICRSYSILHRRHYYSLMSTLRWFYFGGMYLTLKGIWALAYKCSPHKDFYGNIPINSGYGARHKNDETWPLAEVMFEGHLFPCPKNADAYLRDLYGDYSQLPPEDKRKGHAVFMTSHTER